MEETVWRTNRLSATCNDETLCGVAQLNIGWAGSGGYTYLHRNVPIYLLSDDADLKSSVSSFNAIVTPGALPAGADGFGRFGCWDGVCVYKRQGTCTQAARPMKSTKFLDARTGESWFLDLCVLFEGIRSGCAGSVLLVGKETTSIGVALLCQLRR